MGLLIRVLCIQKMGSLPRRSYSNSIYNQRQLCCRYTWALLFQKVFSCLGVCSVNVINFVSLVLGMRGGISYCNGGLFTARIHCKINLEGWLSEGDRLLRNRPAICLIASLAPLNRYRFLVNPCGIAVNYNG